MCLFIFLDHIDSKYYPNVLGIQGLLRFVHLFPYLARKVGKKVWKPNYYFDEDQNQWRMIPGLDVVVEDFRIPMMIDGSYYRSNTPGTGPRGDYHGAERRPNAYQIQRSVYSGYKKFMVLRYLPFSWRMG